MKHSENKRFFFIIGFWIGILLLINGCNSSFYEDKQAEIDSIADKWVPDHREGICTITVAKGKGGSIILRGETNYLQAKQEIIAAFKNPDILLIDSIFLLPDTLKNEKYLGLVSLSVINLRKQPDHKSELVSQAILGTPVLILKNENSWLLIQTPDRYIGWTERSDVKLMSAAEMDEWKQSEKLIYLENSGWIYTTPDESGVVGDLVAGCILKKGEELKGYAGIILPDGREGFVSNKKVMDFDRWKSQVHCTKESICKVAATFLGLPYLWGGSSTKAVDCSGFVQSVYFMNGIILSRDASLQALHGLEVDISDGYSKLNIGDLLFFGSGNNSISHVTHVAIYKGNNEYINSSGRVMINSLDSIQINFNSYRKKSLLSVRRIIGAEGDPGIVPVIKHIWY